MLWEVKSFILESKISSQKTLSFSFISLLPNKVLKTTILWIKLREGVRRVPKMCRVLFDFLFKFQNYDNFDIIEWKFL